MEKYIRKNQKKLLTLRKRYDILVFAADEAALKTLNIQAIPVLTCKAPEKNLRKIFKKISKKNLLTSFWTCDKI